MYSLKVTKADGSSNTLDEIDSLKLAIRIAGIGDAEDKKAVYDEHNNLVWSSEDSPALKRYTELDHEQWQALTHGSHEISGEPSVYFDIDGTLGKWYADGKGLSLEEMIDPANHYFRDIEPIDYMICLAEHLHEQGVDVCVVSAAYKDTIRDKWDWIQEHLPFIPEENICFAPIGADKTDFVKGNADISILVDDYNKNLEQWKGTAIKALNGINSPSASFKSIDLYSIEKSNEARVEKADALYIEGIMTEIAYDKLLETNAYRMATSIKNTGIELIESLDSLNGRYTKDYQLLDRLKQDCEYYLNAGNHNPNNLWAKSEVAQIEKMLELYDKLPTKPMWLTKEQIYDYSEKMDVPARQMYEYYKEKWVKDHIDDVTMTATQAQYENSEEAFGLTFNEYVQQYGFDDGSCYASFAEFRDNEYKAYELAGEIEQFMYDRGEYDYSPDEHVSWLKNGEAFLSRENVMANIINDLESNNVDALINYLDTEESVMSGNDELCDVAERLIGELKAFAGESAELDKAHEKGKEKKQIERD